MPLDRPCVVRFDFETGSATTLGIHDHDAGRSEGQKKKKERNPRPGDRIIFEWKEGRWVITGQEPTLADGMLLKFWIWNVCDTTYESTG